MATAFGALAQGQVDFRSSGVQVTWGTAAANPQPSGTAVAADYDVKVGLYYNGALVSTQFPIVGTTSAGVPNAAFNGRFTGNPSVITVTGLPAGTSGSFEVKGWSGAFTSWEAAASGGALYSGTSGVFQNPSGGAVDPVTGIPGAAAGLTGFTGMQINAIPEPSTYALAGLGLGALLLIRRRK